MKDIRLVDVISLLGGRSRIAIYDDSKHEIKPFFKGCVDEDFKFSSKPTWTSDSKKIKEIRDKYAFYYVVKMTVFDDTTDQTLHIWVSDVQEE